MRRNEIPYPIWVKFYVMADIPCLITYANLVTIA